jgi:hypothetical protein
MNILGFQEQRKVLLGYGYGIGMVNISVEEELSSAAPQVQTVSSQSGPESIAPF